MELNIRLEKNLPTVVSDAVSYETGCTRAQLADPSITAYEHHGAEFTTSDRGALPALFEDLILGRPLPLTLATRSLQDVDTLVAITLFLHRDLAIHPATPKLVYTVDFLHRLGLPALAHIDVADARFFASLRAHFPEGLSQHETASRLASAVDWLREYVLNGTIPVVGPEPTPVTILNQGDNGLVVAKTSGDLWDGWVDLYSLGFLRGILISEGGRKRVLAARKSLHIAFDLPRAEGLLNYLEKSAGQAPGWQVTNDGLWLEHRAGTALSVDAMSSVLTHV
jgi:hypothetical protein